jgi:PAS domain S-box-containing protein
VELAKADGETSFLGSTGGEVASSEEDTRRLDLSKRLAEAEAERQQLQDQVRQLQAQSVALERVNHELELARAQAATIIEASADGIMVVDGGHRILAVNPALERLTGRPAGDLVGRHPCSYVLGARRADGRMLCDTTCPFLHPERTQVHAVDAQIETSGGRQVWVNVAYGTIRDPAGQVQAIVHTIRDINERKELELAKDQFFSVVNHELKNPLASAKGFTQILIHRLQQAEVDASCVGYLKAVDRQLGRISGLVDLLLDVSRAQLGRLTLHVELTDLSALVREVVAHTQVTTDRHQLVAEADEPVTGLWDRLRLEQVLVNLLSNAVKYSPNGGRIVVGMRLSGGQAICSVRDEGVGIPASARSRLFEPYFRANAEQEVAASGLGLGLYLCQQIVAAHGGTICVESEEGKGSTFTFSLPSLPVGDS